MSGLANGFVNLFKSWGKGIGKAADNFLLDKEARKAITDEVEKKFKPKIDRAHRAEDRRAANIKDLGDKLTESKANWKKAQDQWRADYDKALADAKNQRQTEIDNYDTELQGYQNVLDQAKAGRKGILDQLYSREAQYDPHKTLYIDVDSGDKYILNRITGKRVNLSKIYNSLTPKEKQALQKSINDFEDRLYSSKSGKVINAFDDSNIKQYGGKNNVFDNYLGTVRAPQDIALRNADNQITRARSNLSAWQKSNSRPQDWNDTTDSDAFKKTYEQTNGSLPTEYSFNGNTYTKEADLDKAYKDALDAEQTRKDLYSTVASRYASNRNKEIAQRIQDAKDIKKAKLTLGAGAGAGALAAGARAMYGGDDTDNTDNIDNTNYGEPDPDFNVENIPEGQAQLKSDTASINTGFDPDKADALASAAYDQGVEDGSSVRSSGDLVNSIAAATGGHTIDDRLFELIKAMQDPYKADAVANYIYSRHGDDPEVQRLGWRGWLNKYYGDSLRSRMNIDPSGYKGMHVSGGL